MPMPKGMVSILKIVGVVTLVLMILFATGIYYMTRGLDETRSLEIGQLNLSDVPNGTYFGEYVGYRWSNQVEVTVLDQTIKAVTPVQNQAFHMEDPINLLINSILTKQSLDVDMTSGATASSKAFLKAVENALTL